MPDSMLLIRIIGRGGIRFQCGLLAALFGYGNGAGCRRIFIGPARRNCCCGCDVVAADILGATCTVRRETNQMLRKDGTKYVRNERRY